MKIGLVTTYRIDNYGTKLQAYAMQQALKENNNEVCIIDYYPLYDKRPYVLLIKSLRKLKSISSFKNKKIQIKNNYAKSRHEAISSFDKYYILTRPIKGYRYLKKIVLEYDCFVCGSDQIWAPDNNITDFYNLKFVDKKKPTISYAPSFGTTYIPKFLKKSYQEYLRQIDFISVRENSGVQIIKDLINRKVEQVLDPTLLVDEKIWEDLIKEDNYSLPKKKYIFCYFLGQEASHREYVMKLSKEQDCIIINLAHMKGYCEADEKFESINLYDISPITFIRLIKQAEYVCTDSFHGTVFSIIFKKYFLTFERFKDADKNSTNSRIYSLLNLLGLSNRIVKNVIYDNSYHITTPIDYNIVYARLNNERINSRNFLYSALNNIKNNENIR